MSAAVWCMKVSPGATPAAGAALPAKIDSGSMQQANRPMPTGCPMAAAGVDDSAQERARASSWAACVEPATSCETGAYSAQRCAC